MLPRNETLRNDCQPPKRRSSQPELRLELPTKKAKQSGWRAFLIYPTQQVAYSQREMLLAISGKQRALTRFCVPCMVWE